MKALTEYLQEYVQSGKKIGFCRWEDGDGVAWGRILNLTKNGFRFQNVDTLGKDEEIHHYDYSQIVYFDEGEHYARRLELLAQFNPTLPETRQKITYLPEILEVLAEALLTGEVVQISIPGEDSISATVKKIDSGWVEYAYYDDLMNFGGVHWVKVDLVNSVDWRNAFSEADGYLQIMGQSQGEAKIRASFTPTG